MRLRNDVANCLTDVQRAEAIDQNGSQSQRQRERRQSGQHRSQRLVPERVEAGIIFVQGVEQQVEHRGARRISTLLAAEFRGKLADHDAIVEWENAPRDQLIILVSFARDQNRVARRRDHERETNRGTPIRLHDIAAALLDVSMLRARPAAINPFSTSAIIAIGSSLRGLSEVSTGISASRPQSHP